MENCSMKTTRKQQRRFLTTFYNTIIDCVVMLTLVTGFTVGGLLYFEVLVP